ncbi:MAG: SAM-dependent methyltransferase [Bacteroidales bacterium]|nr:SAM-dependent methyltransferase [Bacteroidales bacterium]MBR5671214.1 SAM-dependent methyltransferase [Bacteroidales bacterium]
MYGQLFLIPTPLGGDDLRYVLPDAVFSTVARLDTFVVEEVRTARRFLSAAGLKGRIDTLQLYELNEHSTPQDAERYLQLLLDGRDVGLLSEAGLPAVADPGAALVKLAQEHDIEVVPLVGPSSLMMALMSSGMNGQNFAFNGYLPVKPQQRKESLRKLEKLSAQTGQTQIIIETPYRNDAMLADMLEVLKPATRICIAADITMPTQFIRTKTAAQWKKAPAAIGKRPCVFIISA